ncbi:MAG: transposase [Desulfobacteraceae bacterium]|nr:transposase [Desulfobacteraceae bacterium]
MIIPHKLEKVKKIAESLFRKLSQRISIPQLKFILEMSFGMLVSGSCQLPEIAKTLRERKKPKHVIKRLRRNLDNEKILSWANQVSIQEAVLKIDSSTVLALDGGDITHQYGKKFEHSAPVRDGSSGKIRTGYWLNQISGFNPSTHEVFPILLDLYSTKECGFKSSNNETFKCLDKLVDKIGNIGLWVADRGYDSGKVFSYLQKKKLDFMIRMNDSRNIIYRNKSRNISEVAGKINRRVKYNSKCRFGSAKVGIELENKTHEVTLICFKDSRNKKPRIFLANGHIKSSKELKRRITGYFRRWGVEEAYRFEKQGFGIEQSQTRTFSRIKALLGLTLISWLILIKINETPRTKEAVLQESFSEKDKYKDRPNFIYYRLIRGFREIFVGGRIFSFRVSKEEKLRLRQDLLHQAPLFKSNQTLLVDNVCREMVA